MYCAALTFFALTFLAFVCWFRRYLNRNTLAKMPSDWKLPERKPKPMLGYRAPRAEPFPHFSEDTAIVTEPKPDVTNSAAGASPVPDFASAVPAEPVAQPGEWAKTYEAGAVTEAPPVNVPATLPADPPATEPEAALPTPSPTESSKPVAEPPKKVKRAHKAHSRKAATKKHGKRK